MKRKPTPRHSDRPAVLDPVVDDVGHCPVQGAGTSSECETIEALIWNLMADIREFRANNLQQTWQVDQMRGFLLAAFAQVGQRLLQHVIHRRNAAGDQRALGRPEVCCFSAPIMPFWVLIAFSLFTRRLVPICES
jgi:hypothetical protein